VERAAAAQIPLAVRLASRVVLSIPQVIVDRVALQPAKTPQMPSAARIRRISRTAPVAPSTLRATSPGSICVAFNRMNRRGRH
jgi:hypothetical protein